MHTHYFARVQSITTANNDTDQARIGRGRDSTTLNFAGDEVFLFIEI